MRLPSNVEASAVLLLKELEQSLSKGYLLQNKVILAMHHLKKALDDDAEMLSKDLEALYDRLSKQTD